MAAEGTAASEQLLPPGGAEKVMEGEETGQKFDWGDRCPLRQL
jgi:hypothetical protein